MIGMGIDFSKSMHFLNAGDEINWWLESANLGCSKSQRRIGQILMDSPYGNKDLSSAYKWLFISVALGNDGARGDLSDVHNLMDDDALDAGYELALAWFDMQYDKLRHGTEQAWTIELLSWFFSFDKLH